MKRALYIIIFIFLTTLNGLCQQCSFNGIISEQSCQLTYKKTAGYCLIDNKKINVIQGDSVAFYLILLRSNKDYILAKIETQVYYFIIEKWQVQQLWVNEQGQVNRLVYMRNDVKLKKSKAKR